MLQSITNTQNSVIQKFLLNKKWAFVRHFLLILIVLANFELLDIQGLRDYAKLINVPFNVILFGNYLTALFAILMIFAAFAMIKKPFLVSLNDKKIKILKLCLIGILVGIITGFLGAGGGFLIIPALLFFAKLPFKHAVGTSLFIIFINSFIGFSSDVLIGTLIDYKLLFTITLIAIFGMYIGIELSKKINGEKLKPFFGWFILVMGILIIFKEILKF